MINQAFTQDTALATFLSFLVFPVQEIIFMSISSGSCDLKKSWSTYTVALNEMLMCISSFK